MIGGIIFVAVATIIGSTIYVAYKDWQWRKRGY
jgi:hypothetical protein